VHHEPAGFIGKQNPSMQLPAIFFLQTSSEMQAISEGQRYLGFVHTQNTLANKITPRKRTFIGQAR
jgi:hypothetical protein